MAVVAAAHEQRRQAKEERARAMDTLVSLLLERAELRGALRALILERTPETLAEAQRILDDGDTDADGVSLEVPGPGEAGSVSAAGARPVRRGDAGGARRVRHPH